MNILQLCALSLGGLILILLLKTYHPVFSLAVSLLLTAFLLFEALRLIQSLQGALDGMFGWLGEGNSRIVLRLVGIGILVQSTADVCREAGQPALGEKVVWVGKLMILAVSLPLIQQVLQLLTGLLNGNE